MIREPGIAKIQGPAWIVGPLDMLICLMSVLLELIVVYTRQSTCIGI